MKHIVILGGGTAGSMMANHLYKKLPRDKHKITVLSEDEFHYYQPGFLFIPFDLYKEKDILKPAKSCISSGVNFVQTKVEGIDANANFVVIKGGEKITYDLLIIATGARVNASETEGMEDPEVWRKTVFDFYTPNGAIALREALKNFKGGNLVVHITDMPIKCPVAPLEFAFLADWWLHKKGIRNKTEITFVTPLSGAFTKPTAAHELGYLIKKKNIHMIPDFAISQVEPGKISSYNKKEVPFDLLVTIPLNMGVPLIEDSGLGDELNYVPTDPGTLRSKKHENIFVIGDATDLHTSKAGSVAHFEADILTENIIRKLEGKDLLSEYDGHSNCFVETGFGKAISLDFNYVQEPVHGHYPLPVLGPLSLLKETRINHWGKLAFRWVYWNMLVKAVPMPVGAKMPLAGKKIPPAAHH